MTFVLWFTFRSNFFNNTKLQQLELISDWLETLSHPWLSTSRFSPTLRWPFNVWRNWCAYVIVRSPPNMSPWLPKKIWPRVFQPQGGEIRGVETTFPGGGGKLKKKTEAEFSSMNLPSKVWKAMGKTSGKLFKDPWKFPSVSYRYSGCLLSFFSQKANQKFHPGFLFTKRCWRFWKTLEGSRVKTKNPPHHGELRRSSGKTHELPTRFEVPPFSQSTKNPPKNHHLFRWTNRNCFLGEKNESSKIREIFVFSHVPSFPPPWFFAKYFKNPLVKGEREKFLKILDVRW